MICKPARCTEEHSCPVSECHIHVPRQGVILALELLDGGTVAVLHHLLQEEPERSKIVFREDFGGAASDRGPSHGQPCESPRLAHQVEDATSVACCHEHPRTPVTLESQCVAEERRIRDRLEEVVIETDVGQDEQVARIVGFHTSN